MTHPHQIVDFKACIDERHLSAIQIHPDRHSVFFIVAADGIDVVMMGFIAPSVVHDWHLAKLTFGIVMSAAPLGLVLGALIAGPSSDRLGRKTVLVASVLIFGIGSLVMALAQDV